VDLTSIGAVLQFLPSRVIDLESVFVLALYRSSVAPLSFSLRRAGSLALVGFLFSVPASCQTLQPFVSADVNYDDNLFRLPDGQPGSMRKGDDTYRSVTGGLNFERTVSRQEFSATAKLSSVQFKHNRQLDHTNKNLKGEWHWFFAAHVDGHIGGSYTQALASFADFHSDQRNIRVTIKQYADGKWRFHPSWQLRTGYNRERYVFDLLSLHAGDRTEDAWMTGLDYLARGGNTMGFQFRRVDGAYPGRQFLGFGGTNEGFIQQEAKLNILWLATGSTEVLFLGGHVRRKQGSSTRRVDSGFNSRLVVNWAPVERMRVVGQAWREFAAIEGAFVNSALTTGASAGATWDATEKIQAVVNLKHDRRDFVPGAGVGLSLSSMLDDDSNNTASFGLVYKPIRKLTLQASAFRERRAGSALAGTSSYRAHGASFSVSAQF
jgi:exopolysaccharide biosynthesis operon protein EpsL